MLQTYTLQAINKRQWYTARTFPYTAINPNERACLGTPANCNTLGVFIALLALCLGDILNR